MNRNEKFVITINRELGSGGRTVRTPIPNLLLTGQNLMLHGLEGVTMTALQVC